MKRKLTDRLVGRFWRPGRNIRTADTFWMAHPAVRRSINRQITGDENLWPIDWLKREFVTTPIGRVAVPGCGTGELERDLLSKDLCRRVLAFDLSHAQVEEARLQARRHGLEDRIEYRVASTDRFDPQAEPFDGCFFHQSLHHARDPDAVIRRLADALPPGALVYLDEYIGPSRKQWNRRFFAAAVETYAALPAKARLHPSLRIPGLLAKLSDPSESIASDRILPAVENHLEIVARRDYGGFLLQPIWGQVVQDDALVEELIARERLLCSSHPPWFTVIVARVGSAG
ncbi:MAG TPA: class I SAM-dependent methyltransferase [Thermoanaerobaculia bacterium]|nr:class I SAM-dependent methyltransferase [Thermoanaerobaculia bacterium]